MSKTLPRRWWRERHCRQRYSICTCQEACLHFLAIIFQPHKLFYSFCCSSLLHKFLLHQTNSVRSKFTKCLALAHLLSDLPLESGHIQNYIQHPQWSNHALIQIGDARFFMAVGLESVTSLAVMGCDWTLQLHWTWMLIVASRTCPPSKEISTLATLMATRFIAQHLKILNSRGSSLLTEEITQRKQPKPSWAYQILFLRI